MDLKTCRSVLGGEIVNGQLLCPGPGHTPRDRSMAAKLSPMAQDGFVVHSHAGDPWQQCRDFVCDKLGIPRWQPGQDDRDRRVPGHRFRAYDHGAVDRDAGPRQRTEDDVLRINRARTIFAEGIDPRGTAAEKYLAARSLMLPDDIAEMLRFHPKTPWRNEITGKTDFIPCLLVAFQSVDDDEIVGIHRIRVDMPERWPKTQRRMLGCVHRAAVKLNPFAGETLAIGEGVETCLAARQISAPLQVWALGSVSAISFFPVIDGIRRLIILAEAGRASAEAITICTRRWQGAGRDIEILRPGDGCSDINDELMRRRG